MIFEGLPDTILYILIGNIVVASTILYFMSKDIIKRKKIKDNYEVEKNICKFKYLTKKDRYKIYKLEETLNKFAEKKSINFKVNRDKRWFEFEQYEDISLCESALRGEKFEIFITGDNLKYQFMAT